MLNEHDLAVASEPAEEALAQLVTETIGDAAADLDLRDTATLVAGMTDANAVVTGAVTRAEPQIARAIDAIVERMSRGGRLFYVGSGTPGRIGILDASECPPTFGTDPGTVVGVIAGGRDAVFTAVENAEDDTDAGAADLAAHEITELDSVVGLSASGRTPYVIAALQHAASAGALTVGVVCNPGARISQIAEVPIEVIVGPEFITGSTRLKAGTAQKLVLNTISTVVMVKLGKTYGSLMIDLKITNRKLRSRAERTVMSVTGADEETARRTLESTGDSVKEALLVLLGDLEPERARALLADNGGYLRAALETATERENRR